MSELTIALVPANMIELVWVQAEPLIKTVVDKAPDDLAIEAIKDRLMRGATAMVTISDGTEIVALNVVTIETLDTGMKVMFIPITAGTRMDEWLTPFLDIAKKIAKDYDCTELRGLSVRKGWMKVLKEYGWEESHVVIKCKVGE